MFLASWIDTTIDREGGLSLSDAKEDWSKREVVMAIKEEHGTFCVMIKVFCILTYCINVIILVVIVHYSAIRCCHLGKFNKGTWYYAPLFITNACEYVIISKFKV